MRINIRARMYSYPNNYGYGFSSKNITGKECRNKNVSKSCVCVRACVRVQAFPA